MWWDSSKAIKALALATAVFCSSLTAPPARSVTRVFFASSTFFPDTGKPGTTCVDGDIGTNGNASWSTAWSTADCTDCSTGGVASSESSVGDVSGTPTYSVIRPLFNFDTSSLGSGATISSATLSVMPTATHVDYLTGDTMRMVTNSIASNTDYTTSDFNSFGTTNQASNELSVANDLATNTYASFTLNSTGLGNISKTGVSHFGIRGVMFDIGNTAPAEGTDGSHPTQGGTVVFWNSADNPSGQSRAPKLAVTYTPGTNPARKGDFFFATPPPDVILPRFF